MTIGCYAAGATIDGINLPSKRGLFDEGDLMEKSVYFMNMKHDYWYTSQATAVGDTEKATARGKIT